MWLGKSLPFQLHFLASLHPKANHSSGIDLFLSDVPTAPCLLRQLILGGFAHEGQHQALGKVKHIIFHYHCISSVTEQYLD